MELLLANGEKFPQTGKIGAIEADFNNENGNIAFRVDFANPDRLLRHGQTGTIFLSRVVKDAVVILQRATFEILAKKYAFVIKTDDLEKHGLDKNDAVEDNEAHKKELVKEAAAHNGEHGFEHENAEHQTERGVAQQREILIHSESDDIAND